MKKMLAALGLAGLLSGCATTQAFKPINTVEGFAEGYPVSITRSDENGDKKYDAITVKVRDKTGNRLLSNSRFVDEDYDGLVDGVLADILDAEGNPRPDGSANPDGVYDINVPFEFFFEYVASFGRKPTVEEKKVETVYNALLNELE